jgi:FKBP-type peptidyl-prolyl cis-trans isomerase 2
MAIEDGDSVTIEYTGRLDDGTVFDTSSEAIATENDLEGATERDFSPLTVEVGDGKIVPGLEDALYGMAEGEEATVEVTPAEGYGERSDDRVVEYDADEFRDMVQGHEPDVGMVVRTERGLPGEVVAVEDGVVRIDFNHELAGERLVFEVEVVDVRDGVDGNVP